MPRVASYRITSNPVSCERVLQISETCEIDPARSLADQICCAAQHRLRSNMCYRVLAGGRPMRRRDFITLLGGAAVWPSATRAQQTLRVARIGFLGASTRSGVEERLQRFRAGLRDLGYIEGQNIFIDFRWAEGNYSRLVEFAAELLHLKADVLVTYDTPGTLAAKQTTTTTPIVMIVSGDAVATAIVASLARPGGNVTGSTFFNPELSAKRLEIIKEARPSARRVAILLNPGNPINAPVMGATEIAARSLGLELLSFEARRSDAAKHIFEDKRGRYRRGRRH
jgi:ABC-type uncharacterized transport system substrate-binding protein